jgi:hypothetical protein
VTIIAVVFAGLTWRLADLRAEALILERNQALEVAAVTQAALAWQKAQTEAISQALSRRDVRLEAITQSMADKRQSLDTLERSDAETRNWAEQPLPDGVVSWVRQLGTEADSGAADVHSTATPDQADSGSKAERE